MADEPREAESPEPEAPPSPDPMDREPAEVAAPEPVPIAATPAPPAPPPAPPSRPGWHVERPERAIEIPRARLAARSRRDFLLFAAGLAAAAVGGVWLLPDRTRQRLLGTAGSELLDRLSSRVGLSRAHRERVLGRALTFDDDVAEALYSHDRSVRTYRRSEVTELPNNYHGATPGPEILADWRLAVRGLAAGGEAQLTTPDLLSRFPLREQVTRLVCVEGWSAIAWWGGVRFADFLAAFPPAPGARWAAITSTAVRDSAGRPDPYYVSINLATARHPQTLLATHLSGRPLPLAHGAPLRLLAPMKLGLKNIKAITDIEYVAEEPPDYWNQRGYSKYDGL